MKYILPLALTMFTLTIYGQEDSTKHKQTAISKIYTCNQLKKGFYKNYQEFINNTPSVIENFTVEQQIRSERDSTVISAVYKLTDKTKHIHGIWGFCDGNDIYVNYDNSMSKRRGWRLGSLGQYNFFTYLYKSGILAGISSIEKLLVTALTSTSHFINPAQCNVMVIDFKGKFQYPDHAFLKKLLSSQPDLMKAFEEDWVKYEKFDYTTEEPEPDESREEKMKVIKQYLTAMNERLVKLVYNTKSNK